MPLIRPSVVETADAAASIGTAYTLSVGQSVQGTISARYDHDWYKIALTAGQTYTFAQIGTGATPLRDAYLYLRNASGTVLASDDDSGPASGSTFTFTPTTSGMYYVDAAAHSTGTGQYGVSVTSGSRADYDVLMGSGALDSSLNWGTRGSSAVVTYAFRDTAASYTVDGSDIATVSRLSPQEIATVEQILKIWSESSGITFQRVNSTGYSDNATILFGNYSDASDGAGAFAFYPGATGAVSEAGDVWLNLANGVSTTSNAPGTFSFFAILHEVGHAIGLSHPGDYNAAPGVTITYANSAQFTQDTQQYSIMSYFGGSATGENPGGFSSGYTPMMFDIYEMQRLYGANMSTRSGDTVYGFDGNAGTLYAFPSPDSTLAIPRYCIWDGGGTDTINASGYAKNQTIDLNEGTFSNIGGGTANISIALNCVIENANGGSGNDMLIGNSVANVLKGGAGNDTFVGGGGNDVIDGGAGTDTAIVRGLRGGGFDVLSYGGVVYTLDRAEHAYDTNANIEYVAQSNGTQSISVTQVRNFDPQAYVASYNDLSLRFHTSVGGAFSHYIEVGFYEGRETTFDARQYLANYVDLRAAFGNDVASATHHFLQYGVDEHRLAENPLEYIASYDDLILAFRGQSHDALVSSGLSHYRDYGSGEGRRTHIDFDETQYLANWSDLQAAFGTDGDAAAMHFIEYGYLERRLDENPFTYIASYRDLTAAFRGHTYEGLRSDAFNHYHDYGFGEGRRNGVKFDVDQYLANYADLRTAFFDASTGRYDEQAATIHYITYGFGEGRTDLLV